MSVAKFKIATRPLLSAGIVCGASIFLGGAVNAADAPKERNTRSWIDQRVADWALSDEERRFDEIGWANGLDEAGRLARESHRPLFVFTYSGSATEPNAIALRRC